MSNKRKLGISTFYLTSKKNLSSKYNSFENSYTLVCINNLIYTETCHIVARFKDFLYYDDDTEFLNKFFHKNDQKKILTKVFNFYSKYCKVFPNYMILPENQFLYRNLRKKQKLIDQFNEIKKEEEENRKHLKLKKNKNNENNYIIFGKKEQDSIDKYKPSFTQSTIIMTDYLNFHNNSNNEKSKSKILNDINNSKNSITISLNYNNNNLDMNDMNSSELTLISITNLIKKSPTKTEKNNGNKSSNNKLTFTPTKNKTKSEKFNINDEKVGSNFKDDLKKKYISYYQNKKNGSSNIFTNNIKINKANNTNYSSNVSNKTTNNKKEFASSKKNSINTNNTNLNSNNNISQAKTTNIILISSITKTSKGKDSKNVSKNIKSAITKKKLFTTTEKTITHKRPIYNYQNKKVEKNSNSINNNNKHKKNYKDMISISIKPSISPPGTKINSLKLKIIDNLIKSQGVINKNNNVKSPTNNNSNTNNLSYVTKVNKNLKPNENEKINTNLDKKVIKNNATNKKITTKEKMKNYKILRMDKTNHFSHDINKNQVILSKNTFSNFTEKISYKNTSNDKIRKAEQSNKYISPATKKYTTLNNKNIKTPNKPELKQNDNIKKIIINTKEGSQVKIQSYIKKILDKNNTKKELIINKPKIK